jgi:hypothetical protein
MLIAVDTGNVHSFGGKSLDDITLEGCGNLFSCKILGLKLNLLNVVL